MPASRTVLALFACAALAAVAPAPAAAPATASTGSAAGLRKLPRAVAKAQLEGLGRASAGARPAAKRP